VDTGAIVSVSGIRYHRVYYRAVFCEHLVGSHSLDDDGLEAFHCWRIRRLFFCFSRRWSQAVIFEAVEHRLFASWLCSAVSAILLPDAEFFPSMSLSFTHRPNQSPEPTAVGAYRSAVAVHAASRRWLSFFR
jgi:hypothetical protein